MCTSCILWLRRCFKLRLQLAAEYEIMRGGEKERKMRMKNERKNAAEGLNDKMGVNLSDNIQHSLVHVQWKTVECMI